MSNINRGAGFTIVEVIITIAVMSIFLTFLYQAFLVGQSQQLATIRLGAANDLAQTNLRKITDRSQISVTCDATTGPSNTNNLVLNASAAGSDITFTPESTLPPSLPTTTTQQMKVQYPQGCAKTMPAKVMSIVTYGLETIVRVSYVTTPL
jgi:prepilin-type N-terminal cleavage/methylation domain-containing protein